jgi:hypothetical protein
MNSGNQQFIRANSTQLVLGASGNLILKAGGVECMYTNSTGIPYVFKYPPTHISHVVTKQYVDAQTLNVVKTNTASTFTVTPKITSAIVSATDITTKQYVDAQALSSKSKYGKHFYSDSKNYVCYCKCN